jgi:ubiquinone/menaquinone biosynthesis C-methylase UbiE
MLRSVMQEYFPPKLNQGIDALALLLFRKGVVHWGPIPLPAWFFGSGSQPHTPDAQNLDVYWSIEMTEALEAWGEGTVWREILYLTASASGRILDIACGTGKVIELVSRFPDCEVYGIDISDLLIQKAVERGIPEKRLKVCDATTMTGYADDYFDYSYSIGSFEHFTEAGIEAGLHECGRVTRHKSFHMVPTARSGNDDGWITTTQSYFNNTPAWWLEKFDKHFEHVFVLDSQWRSALSLGKWFVCSGHKG